MISSNDYLFFDDINPMFEQEQFDQSGTDKKKQQQDKHRA